MSDTSQDEEDVPVGNTSPQESQEPEQELPDPTKTADTEPANTKDPQDNAKANDNGQHAAELKAGDLHKRYRMAGNFRGVLIFIIFVVDLAPRKLMPI